MSDAPTVASVFLVPHLRWLSACRARVTCPYCGWEVKWRCAPADGPAVQADPDVKQQVEDMLWDALRGHPCSSKGPVPEVERTRRIVFDCGRWHVDLMYPDDMPEATVQALLAELELTAAAGEDEGDGDAE